MRRLGTKFLQNRELLKWQKQRRKANLTVRDVSGSVLYLVVTALQLPNRTFTVQTKATVKNRSKLGRFLLSQKIFPILLLGPETPNSTFFTISKKKKNIFPMRDKISSQNFRPLAVQLALCLVPRPPHG